MKTISKDKEVLKGFKVTFTLNRELAKYAKCTPEKMRRNEKFVANSNFKF